MAAKNVATVGSGVFTPEGFAAALLQFGEKDAGKAVRMALDKSKGTVASIFVNRFASRGVGRGIFGKAKRGAYKLVKLKAIGPRPDHSFLLAMELRGFAAMQEVGGRTKPHRIPKQGRSLRTKAMAFGDGIFARSVKHPGGAVRRDPSGDRAFELAADKIRQQIDRNLVALIASRLKAA